MSSHEHKSVPERMAFEVVRSKQRSETSMVEKCACGATRTIRFKSNRMWAFAPATREEWQPPTPSVG